MYQKGGEIEPIIDLLKTHPEYPRFFPILKKGVEDA
jgi:hypothetical protein